MRSSGLVGNARGLRPHDHLCWRYDESADLRPRVQEFLSEGLAIGERVCYVGSAPAETLINELREFDGMGDAINRGAAQVVTLPLTGTVVASAQVRAYADATADALAAGFTGLRVVAEATPLVRTSAQLDAFARCEHLVDQYLAGHPFSAMCAYNRGELGDDVIEQLACLHPKSNQDNVLFRLHASAAADDYSGSLSGELDLSTADLFLTALDRAELPLHDGELVIDARGLEFIDHRNLLRLHEHARRRAATLVLHVYHSGPARIVKVLDVADVRVELH